MDTLQITKANAVKAHNSADPNVKKLLEELFGPENFKQEDTRSIMERVQSFDDILSISGKTMADIAKDGDTPDEVAYKQAKLIAEVYNEGTVLDVGDTDQYKYFPWHKVVKTNSGFALSYYSYGAWTTDSTVGVRLCFKSSELAVDAGKKFIDIYTILKTK